MAVKILVASPINSFGELIRATLASQGDYEVKVCDTGNQVLDAMTGERFDILILDAALNDLPFAPLVQKIVACVPEQKIAIIPPENKPDHPLMEDVPAHGFLFRPFLDPDLINLVQRLASAAADERHDLQDASSAGLVEDHKKTPWPQDPKTAGVELSRLLLGSSALAGIILRDGSLFVHSGRISENAAQEIVQMFSQVKNDREKDLVRFTFLVADDCEALVYGVSLLSDWTLALVYDVSMPLTRVRSQATMLAARLREQMSLEDLLDSPGEVGTSPEDTAEETETEADESEEVDISAILKEINAKEDISSDEFLNLNSLDNELFSLINEVNAPPEPQDPGAADFQHGEEPAPVEKIYTRPLKLPETMAADAQAAESSLEEVGQSAQADDEIPVPTSESTEAAEAGVSDLDALEMAAALSQLEEEMGVVVGEDIPLLETPLADESPAPGAEELVTAGFQPDEEFGEPAEGQTIPDNVPPVDEPVLADETLRETDEPAAMSHAAILSDGPQSEMPMVPDSPAADRGEGIPHGQSILQEEETPAVSVSDTRPTPLAIIEENPVDDQVNAGIPEITKISPPAMALPEEDLRESIFEQRHTPIGDQFYTVVFTPRQSGQFLTGELVEYLGNLLKKTKAGFPWRLTGVAIRPDYLRLSLEISRHLDPTEIISFIKIYTEYAIRQNIPYSDKTIGAANFWAEEHLVITDDSIPEGDQLREFLKSVKPQPGNPL